MSISLDEEEEKPRTVFVGNVPQDVKKRDIENVFGDIGPMKRCYVQYIRDKDKGDPNATTVAYVTYAISQDATSAIEKLSGHKFGNHRVNLKLIACRSDQKRSPMDLGRPSANSVPLGEKQVKPRPKKVNKKSRVIVRNLSFNADEEKIREHFGKIGEIKEVNVLRKKNGKLVGCCFIQFGNVPQAAKAIKDLNSKPFLGRPVAIDWAIPKKDFEKAQDGEVKEEPKDDTTETVEIKKESEDQSRPKHIKKENQSYSESDEGEDDDGGEGQDSENEEKEQEDKKPFKTKVKSNDVAEGKTLFLRNLDFDLTEERLKEFFEQFGPLHYALICRDKLTEHPKGTGFVKFKDAESATNCLQGYQENPSKFTLDRAFSVTPAVSKDEVEKLKDKPKDQDSKPKNDKRNLYLAREGFVRIGSEASEGVSNTDMSIRSSLNKVKKQMLKNLNVFISPTRLCVHNIPDNFTDSKLRALFLKHGGEGSKITESKIIRNLKDIGPDNLGTSKGYGFVNFSDHQSALTALRAINNNPNIFTTNRRPIVEFSLENRAAILSKEKRLMKSREGLKRKLEKTEEEVDASQKSSKKRKERRKKAKLDNPTDTNKTTLHSGDKNEECADEFSGLASKKGITTIPSMKPKHKLTRNSLKSKKTKVKKLQPRRKREGKQRPKTKANLSDKLDKIVERRKSQLEKGIVTKKKKKWYEKKTR